MHASTIQEGKRHAPFLYSIENACVPFAIKALLKDMAHPVDPCV